MFSDSAIKMCAILIRDMYDREFTAHQLLQVWIRGDQHNSSLRPDLTWILMRTAATAYNWLPQRLLFQTSFQVYEQKNLLDDFLLFAIRIYKYPFKWKTNESTETIIVRIKMRSW